MATYSSILALRIPWMAKPSWLQSIGLERVRHNWSSLAHTYILKRHLRKNLSFPKRWLPDFFLFCCSLSYFCDFFLPPRKPPKCPKTAPLCWEVKNQCSLSYWDFDCCVWGGLCAWGNRYKYLTVCNFWLYFYIWLRVGEVCTSYCLSHGCQSCLT